MSESMARCPKCGSDKLGLYGSSVKKCYVECANSECDFDSSPESVADFAAFFPIARLRTACETFVRALLEDKQDIETEKNAIGHAYELGRAALMETDGSAESPVARLQAERDAAQQRVKDMVRIYEKDEVWHWQGDGEDHLESLTCPIIIRPEQLRTVISKAEAERDELLGALKDAVHRLERIDGFGCPQSLIDEMRAAIKKVEGQ